MKKTYHLCLSAGDEILFRDFKDFNRGFNCFALALFKTESTGLVEAFMSTHIHLLVQSSDPGGLMYNLRNPYSKYFNSKYQRAGRLGEKYHFSMEVIGFNHMIAAASYVLRNAVHHGISPTPYAYPHCSANAIFRREMGKFLDEKLISTDKYSGIIGRRAEYPDSYKMTESGIFLRESVLDIPQVENLFGTPRAFNFYMSRKTSEEWEAEQEKDKGNQDPITLSNIEKGIPLHSLNKMLSYESGKADYRKISDTELCIELDNMAQEKYAAKSVYRLSPKEKRMIAEELYRKRHLSESQIRRCLAYPKQK